MQVNALNNGGLDSGKLDQLPNASATNMFLNRIDKKLNIIIECIQRNPNSNIQLPSLDSKFLSSFPMNDVESLININELLKDDQNIAKLVNIFTVKYNLICINENFISV